jgi:hypothetical protein
MNKKGDITEQQHLPLKIVGCIEKIRLTYFTKGELFR